MVGVWEVQRYVALLQVSVVGMKGQRGVRAHEV